MSKAGGVLLKGRIDIVQNIANKIERNMTQEGRYCLFLRKLKNFNPMILRPCFALQDIKNKFSSSSSPQVEVPQLLNSCFLSGGGARRTALTLEETKRAEKDLAPVLSRCNFNAKQKEALIFESATPIGPVCIQGPPGTGKSFLISSGILPSCLNRGEQVLVLCNSNAAVDSIFEKVIGDNPKLGNNSDLKKKCIRMGYKAKVSKIVKQNGCFEEMDSVALSKMESGAASVLFTTLYKASSLHDNQVFCGKRVDNEPGIGFTTLIIDEAGQIEDSKLFIMLARMPSLKKVILVGDYKQLQPYVTEGVRSQGYGISTLERLVSRSSDMYPAVHYVMLEVQHRCPSTVRGLVSKLFYEDKLVDGANITKTWNSDSGPGRLMTPGRKRLPSIMVFDLSFGDADFNRFQRSMENLTEADVTKLIYDFTLDYVRKCDGENTLPIVSRDICILAPYNRHKNRLRTVIAGIPESDWHKFENMREASLDFGKEGSSVDEKTIQARNIDTVDKFQGSEREVVIINSVLSSASASEGRGADPHFLNVACSRSKGMLVLVGHISILAGVESKKKNKWWKGILDYCKSKEEETGGSEVMILPCTEIEDVIEGLKRLHVGGRKRQKIVLL
eukprot:CAMPEP_0194163604 /NCGR_PEP_ID=MMETSP0152-20130528/80135_1 /TAXON_ID=1049557 /ORGANISM="Thalassiothrix antarctica, Strain L6-D1" /LENGTH=616 /DNA_ID=CAMNT_0038873615 /DNA_START=128 /DNA_END=1978 /DNA_ORIENTATION=+